MKQINIFILRHGQTKGTERHRYYGRTDMPLSKKGVYQIKKLNPVRDRSPLVLKGLPAGLSQGGRLPRSSAGWYRGSSLRRNVGGAVSNGVKLRADYVYSSPLQRCIQTANILLGKKHIPMEISNDLIEIDFGEWEGLTLNQMKKRNPRKFNDWLYDFANFKMPGGESVKSMIKRVNRFWKYVIKKHHRGNVLIVTHGGPAKVIVMKALGLPMKSFWRITIGTGELWEISH